MNWVVVAGALAATGGVAVLVALVLDGQGGKQRLIEANLTRGFASAGPPRARRRSDRRGGIGRVLGGNAALAGRIDRLLARAGRPHLWPLERVINAKVLIGLSGLGLGVLLLLSSRTLPMVLVLALLPLLGFFLPDLLLYNMAIKRRQAVELELPDTLDQMSIAVDAGLGFDSAMLRVARNGKGVLADELIRTLQDLQVGRPRRLAYEELSDRCGVADLRRFIRSILQAEEYGIALSDVLKTQADEMRIERRQRAERKAMELPVKLTFPLILLILPVILIVILGPAIITMMGFFSR